MRTVLIRFVGLEIPLSSIMCSFRPNVVGASPLVGCNFFSFSIHALARRRKPVSFSIRWSRNWTWYRRPCANSAIRFRTTLASSNVLPSRASTTSSILSSSSSLTPPTLSSSWISTASALLLYHLPGLMPPKWCRPVTPDFEEKDGWNTFNLLDKVFAYKEAARGESRTGTYPLLCIGFVCIIDRRCDSRTRYSFLKSRRYTRYRPFWTSK